MIYCRMKHNSIDIRATAALSANAAVAAARAIIAIISCFVIVSFLSRFRNFKMLPIDSMNIIMYNIFNFCNEEFLNHACTQRTPDLSSP